jgi:taurine--2-oxoglutarate transaminase
LALIICGLRLNCIICISTHILSFHLRSKTIPQIIENAIKLARLYTGRHKILSRYQSYHGASIGAISASGDPRRIPVDAQQAPNFVHFDLPYFYRWEYGEENLLKEAVAQLERMLAYEGPGTIAAILLEGESGFISLLL